MGWGNCGTDSNGRPIGYVFEATCDHPGCNAEIDRGLSYACGDMHGDDEISCEKYFCGEHRRNFILQAGRYRQVCDECAKAAVESDFWMYDDDEGVILEVIEIE